MKPQTIFRLGAILLAAGIGAGAFGAHGLKDKVTPALLETFEIGVRYQMYGALGLMATAAWFSHCAGRCKACSIIAIFVGIIIFSGTLYGIVMGGPKWLGAITPIGGTMQIVGWCIIAASSYSERIVKD